MTQASTKTVHVAYPAGDRVARMQVGGMSVVERIVRDAGKAGATHAIVHAQPADLPDLAGLPIAVEVSPAPAPADALPGDVIAGVTITDERSRRAATRALLQTCRRPYDGVADRYVIRSMSLRLTRVLAALRVTPNQVTFANIAVGLGALAFAQHGTRLAYAIAGALMILQLVLDSCDGELARLRHLHSRFGMILDNVSDDVIDNSFVAMLGLGLGGIWAPIGIAAGLARGAVAVMVYLELARAGKHGDVLAFAWWFDKPDESTAERYAEERRFSILGAVRSIGRRDLYGFLFGVTCLVGLPQAAFGIGLAVCATYFVLGVLHVLRR